MKVFFSGFWGGFLDDKEAGVHIFIKLLNDIFNEEIIVSNNLDDADILFNSVFNKEHKDDYYLNYKKWKFSFLFTGEACYSFHNRDEFNDNINYLSSYTCILGFNSTNDNFVEFPFYIVFIKSLSKISFEPCKSIINNNTTSAVISNLHWYDEAKPPARLLFLNKLDKRMNVLYGGSYKNNIGGKIEESCYSDNLINFYKISKFVIAMENTKIENYITEKLINGFRAGIVPIYWGSPYISKHFNPKRFIVLEDDSESSMDAVINRMINMSDEEYFRMVNEPIFNEGMNIDTVYNNAINNIKKIIFKNKN
jgi:hypothetical protein